MVKVKRLRWAVLMCALSFTIVAIYYPVETDESTSTSLNRTPRAAAGKVGLDVQVTVDSSASTAEADIDPFAPRSWQAPPIQVQQQTVATVQSPIPPAVVGPPPLPFRFMGRMNDEGQQFIYLSRGEQTIVAHNGETLDGTYKVIGIEQQRIQFEYLPTGEKQELVLTATEN